MPSNQPNYNETGDKAEKETKAERLAGQVENKEISEMTRGEREQQTAEAVKKTFFEPKERNSSGITKFGFGSTASLNPESPPVLKMQNPAEHFANRADVIQQVKDLQAASEQGMMIGDGGNFVSSDNKKSDSTADFAAVRCDEQAQLEKVPLAPPLEPQMSAPGERISNAAKDLYTHPQRYANRHGIYLCNVYTNDAIAHAGIPVPWNTANPPSVHDMINKLDQSIKAGSSHWQAAYSEGQEFSHFTPKSGDLPMWDLPSWQDEAGHWHTSQHSGVIASGSQGTLDFRYAGSPKTGGLNTMSYTKMIDTWVHQRGYTEQNEIALFGYDFNTLCCPCRYGDGACPQHCL